MSPLVILVRDRGAPENVDLGLMICLKVPVLRIKTKLLATLQVLGLGNNSQVIMECLP